MSGVPDGPSKDAGIIQNDVILVFDGHEVEDVRDLIQTVGNTPVGKAVDVIVLRGGERLILSVTLGLRDDENLARAVLPPELDEAPEAPKELTLFGITLSNLTDNMRKGLGLKLDASGLLVMDVDETSDAFEKGLRAGDLVTEAGQKKVTTVTEFQEQVATTIEGGRKTMLLLVRRGNDPRFLALSMKD